MLKLRRTIHKKSPSPQPKQQRRTCEHIQNSFFSPSRFRSRVIYAVTQVVSARSNRTKNTVPTASTTKEKSYYGSPAVKTSLERAMDKSSMVSSREILMIQLSQ